MTDHYFSDSDLTELLHRSVDMTLRRAPIMLTSNAAAADVSSTCLFRLHSRALTLRGASISMLSMSLSEEYVRNVPDDMKQKVI